MGTCCPDLAAIEDIWTKCGPYFAAILGQNEKGLCCLSILLGWCLHVY